MFRFNVIRNEVLVFAGIAMLLQCACLHASSDENAIRIIDEHKAYFTKLHSLRYDAKMTLQQNAALRQESGVQTGKAEFDLSFWYDGGRFKSRTVFTDQANGEKVTKTMTYDGQMY